METKLYIYSSKKKTMSTPPNSEEFYEKLRSQLYETTLWPSEYLYKFIVKTNKTKIAATEALFDNMGAVIEYKGI